MMRMLTIFMTILIMTTMHTCKRILRRLVMALLIGFLVGTAPADAQKNGDNGKKRAEMMKELQEFKIKYLIQEAGITPEQQPEFIKLYTEMDNAKLNMFKARRESRKALSKNPSPTDEDYNRVSEEMADAKNAEGAIDKSYYLQFKKLLSPKQLYKMKDAEARFNHKMMHMRKNRDKK